MIPKPLSFVRRAFVWLIQRNPTYLASACLVAVGAHGLLVDPTDPAGDVALIIVTLAALQCYEWAVGAILVALYRARRAPEDAPMLLFVGALFWTGPIAATLEMIAINPSIGAAVAAGACLVAIGEMIAVARMLGLRLQFATYLVGAACVTLLAVAAPLLKMPVTASGINEILLYAAWWALGALVLGCRGIARSYCNLKLAFPTVAVQSPSLDELKFLIVTLIATAVHLVGMNYGYFCHAEPFYAAPALVAAAAVGVSLLHPFMRGFMAWVTIFSALPLVAIVLAVRPFDAHVPVDLLPSPLRHPLMPTLVIAALAWFYGFARHRFITLFHVANAALALAAYRTLSSLDIVFPASPGRLQNAALALIVAYLTAVAIVRRSRGEALAALAIGYAALFRLVWNQTPADELIVVIALGWFALAALHVAVARPKLVHRLLPVAMLAVNPWLCDSAGDYRLAIAAHTALLVVVLIFIGTVRPWTHYRPMGVALAAIHLSLFAARWIAGTPSPAATILTMSGFALLFAGAAVSWHKETLIALLPPPSRPPDSTAAPGESLLPRGPSAQPAPSDHVSQ